MTDERLAIWMAVFDWYCAPGRDWEPNHEPD